MTKCVQRNALNIELLEDRWLPSAVTHLGMMPVGNLLMVSALDSSNRIVPNYTGTVSFASTGPGFQVPANYTFKVSDSGVAFLPWSNYSYWAPPASINSRDTRRPSITGTLQVGGVVGGVSSDILVFAPKSVELNAPFAIDLTAEMFGLFNRDELQYVSITFSSDDKRAILPPGYTISASWLEDNFGQVHIVYDNVVLRKVGARTITVSISNGTKTYERSVSTIAGTYMDVSTNGNGLIANAGRTEYYSISAMLAGNVNYNYSGMVRFESTDPLAILPANYRFTPFNGPWHAFTVVFRTAGNQYIRIVDAVTNVVLGEVRRFVAPGPVTQLFIGTPKYVGAGSLFNMSVVPMDRYGNTQFNTADIRIYESVRESMQDGYTGVISFSSSDANATLPEDYRFSIDEDYHVFQVKGFMPRGNMTIRVEDIGIQGMGSQVVVGIQSTPLLAMRSKSRGQAPEERISDAQLAILLAEALARWQAVGKDLTLLNNVKVKIIDFGDRTLSSRADNVIWIDDDAAGWGWFVDNSPADDREYRFPKSIAIKRKFDLLTVIQHEVGHMLGIGDMKNGVMSEVLLLGSRRSPN